MQADLKDFARHVSSPADLKLCVDDTLTHLQSVEEIGQLFPIARSIPTSESQFLQRLQHAGTHRLGLHWKRP
jgi:hypothetical protein